MRQGRLGRAIREHLSAHPDEAFSTDDLCAVCYPGVHPVERKHRVAVLRAAGSLPDMPDWRCRYARVRGGYMARFYNAASMASTTQAGIREAERAVLDHVVMRHGTEEQRQHVAARREAESMLTAAKLQYAAAVCRNPVGVLLDVMRPALENLPELAEKARDLITENDPDAIREGPRELAEALDGITRETKDPMATVQARLAS